MRAELQEMTEQERLIQEANVLRQSEVGSRGRKYRLARRQQLENPVMEVHHKILQCQMEEIHKFVATLSQSSGIVHKKDFEILKTNLDRINSRLGTLEEVIKVESESTRLPKLFSKALSKMEVLEYTVMTHVGADGWVVLPQSPPDALSAPQRAAQSLQRKICGVLSTAVHDAAELSSRAAKLFAEFDRQASGKLSFETLLRGWNSVLPSKLTRTEVEVFMAAAKSSSHFLDQQSFVRAVLVVVRSKQGGDKVVQSAFVKQLLQHVGSGNNARAVKALFEQIDGPEKYGKIDVNAMLDWAESKGITLTEQEAADFIAIGETYDNMLDAKQFQQAVQRLLGTSAAGARDGGAVPSAQVLGASRRGRGGQAPSAAEPSGLMSSNSRSLRSSSRGRGERESALKSAILQHVGSGSDSRAIKALFEHIDGPEKYGTIDVNAMLDWAESKGITLTEQEAADFIAIGEASDNMLDANQFQQAVQRLLGTSAAGARDGGAVPSAQVLGASQRGRGGQAPSAAEPSVSAFAKLVNSRVGDGDISQSSLKLFREVDSEQLGTIDSVALSAWANRLKVDVNVQDVERFIESANPGTFAPTEGNLTAVNRT